MANHESQLLESLFHQACELDLDAQAQFINENCSDYPELAQKLKNLLQADIRTDNVGALVNDNILDLNEQMDLWQGKRVGAYTIIKELGRGGMGSVYLAKRTDFEFEQQVAIKFLARNLFAQTARTRFVSERQILAKLNHPNIARLLDGGTTENGVPYLIMEYVDGLTLEHYLQKQKPSPKALIDLFIKICEAVQYAHQNLVVHRDIKPSNIIITPDGEPKLLDFGIAKILDSDEALEQEVQDLTQTGMQILTPEFASPEQVSGDAITIRSDVYTLGIILFRLLTGSYPFVAPELTQTSPAQRYLLIPPKASQKASTKQSRHFLKGDFDRIINKALRGEPERRYPTVNALIEDIKNFQHKRPISARPDSLSMRAQYWLRRNPLLATGIAIGMILISGWGIRENQLRQLAELEARRHASISDYLVTIFRDAGPDRNNGKELRASELLEKGKTAIEKKLRGDPALSVPLIKHIAAAHSALGNFQRGIEYAKEALTLQEAHNKDDHAQVADLMMRIGDYHMGLTQYAEAEAWLDKSISRWRQIHPLPGEAWVALNNIALAKQSIGKYDEALNYYQELEALLVENPSHLQDAAFSLNHNQGILFEAKGDIDTAIKLYRRAMDIAEEQNGKVSTNYTGVFSSYIIAHAIKDRPSTMEKREQWLKELIELNSNFIPMATLRPTMLTTLWVTCIWIKANIEKPKRLFWK